MKKLVLAALGSLFVCMGARAQSDLLSTVQDWVGTGANEAGFVIDWYNGTTSESLMWGYRWNGSATGEQMFDAIVASDPRLYAEVSDFDTGGYGTAVFGLGFAATGDAPIQLSPSLNFNSQHLAYADSYDAVDDSRTAVNAGDLWQEGWYSAGYWSYYNSTDARLSVNESDWDSSYDMTDRVLENGDFDGWVFDADFAYPGPVPSDFTAVAPAPEPTVWAWLFAGGTFFLCIRRHSFSAKNKLS